MHTDQVKQQKTTVRLRQQHLWGMGTQTALTVRCLPRHKLPVANHTAETNNTEPCTRYISKRAHKTEQRLHCKMKTTLVATAEGKHEQTKLCDAQTRRRQPITEKEENKRKTTQRTNQSIGQGEEGGRA